MAVIVKTKRDGTKKVRIVIVIRRSGANARSAVPERPVLPRPTDAISDGLSCLSSPPGRLTPHADMDDLLDEVQEGTVEQVPADFGDSYMHLAVKEEELKHCIVREPTRYLRSTGRKFISPTAKAMAKQQAHAGYKVLPMGSFGSKRAPLVWSRVAAAISRMTAAMLKRRRSKVQIYLDDPLLHLVGNRRQRCRLLSAVLLVWAACGFRIAWHKGQQGGELDWIGLLVSFDHTNKLIKVRCTPQRTGDIKAEVQELMQKTMLPLKAVMRLASRLSWCANVLTRMRWIVSRLWAAINDTERTAHEVIQGTRPRPQARNGGDNCFWWPEFALMPPLRWLSAVWGQSFSGFERSFSLSPEVPPEQIVVDASPWAPGRGPRAQTYRSSVGVGFRAHHASRRGPIQGPSRRSSRPNYLGSFGTVMRSQSLGKFLKDQRVQLLVKGTMWEPSHWRPRWPVPSLR